MPPGRGAQVEHALARLRVDDARDAAGGARLRRERARGVARVREGVEAARRDDRVALAVARASPRSKSTTSVLTRSASSAGSLSAASSARASSAPSQSHHSSTSHSRVRVADRGALGRVVGGQLDALALHPAQHGVDEPVAGARLGQLDRLADRGVVGDPVEEQQLVEPELQRGAHGRVELAVGVLAR